MASGKMGGDAFLMFESQIKKCENSRKKTSICRLVMKCGGISHHWYILLMVVQVERPSRQSGS
jgi:hypothetical protein